MICCLAVVLHLLLAVLDLYFGLRFTLAVLGFAWISLGLACGLSWLAFAEALPWPGLTSARPWTSLCIVLALLLLDFGPALTLCWL